MEIRLLGPLEVWTDDRRVELQLRDALALWHGPPPADFAYERFAQVEIARLEELRIAALEDRVEADLAAGRDVELVPEVEALAAAHPCGSACVAGLCSPSIAMVDSRVTAN